MAEHLTYIQYTLNMVDLSGPWYPNFDKHSRLHIRLECMNNYAMMILQ